MVNAESSKFDFPRFRNQHSHAGASHVTNEKPFAGFGIVSIGQDSNTGILIRGNMTIEQPYTSLLSYMLTLDLRDCVQGVRSIVSDSVCPPLLGTAKCIRKRRIAIRRVSF